jgi:DNA-binding transcriptional regulator PaaX
MPNTQNSTLNVPRPGTKTAKLVSALSGKGKTLRALSKSLGWQAHTVRAAITRLRQRGYVIERERKNRSAQSVYRLVGTGA